MKATQLLHELGQSLWLDNIRRARRRKEEYAAEFSFAPLRLARKTFPAR